MRFVDTNVLLYLISTVPEEAAKASIAGSIITGGGIAMSVQVLQEFYVQATRHRSAGHALLTHSQAATMMESFLIEFPVQAMSAAVLRGALNTRERYGISYWDAAIIEAARLQGCDTVLSEDLSHGQQYGPVRVENPFL